MAVTLRSLVFVQVVFLRNRRAEWWWDRIEALIKLLKADPSIHLVSPSDVLSYADDPSSGKTSFT